jgi:hypothetical protein
VLYVLGHAVAGKHHEGYQEIFQTLVQAGLVVLALDPLGQGERLGYYDARRRRATIGGGTSEHEYAGIQCLPLGDCITRYFVHDAMRGVDYLLTRPEVDSKRIGFTGESGGGLHTGMMMMADPRIAAAAPALYITSHRAYLWAGGGRDAEQVWRESSGMQAELLASDLYAQGVDRVALYESNLTVERPSMRERIWRFSRPDHLLVLGC